VAGPTWWPGSGKSLSSYQRSEIAKNAAAARWKSIAA
jgi:hypothetical protein